MFRARVSRIWLVPVLLAATAGCRNPFDPSSDADLQALQWQAGGLQNIYMTQSDLSASSPNFNSWLVEAKFLIRNRVGITLDSMNVVYTDANGNPTTGYASTGGRTIHLFIRLDGVRDDNTGAEGNAVTVFSLPVVDYQVWTAMGGGSSSTVGHQVINATVTFRGADDNGYEQKFVGQISIIGP